MRWLLIIRRSSGLLRRWARYETSTMFSLSQRRSSARDEASRERPGAQVASARVRFGDTTYMNPKNRGADRIGAGLRHQYPLVVGVSRQPAGSPTLYAGDLMELRQRIGIKLIASPGPHGPSAHWVGLVNWSTGPSQLKPTLLRSDRSSGYRALNLLSDTVARLISGPTNDGKGALARM